MDVEALKEWFLREKREMPWRDNATPYGVWVSEVMLQQTQVAVVIPYYKRWMNRFPTVQVLAEAKLDEVIKMWEGLGYYSRARNLHRGAQEVMERFGGALPNNAEELSSIKGIGPYTLGAILSFAFHQKVTAVDGNVLRVISRYEGIEEEITKPKTVQLIRAKAEALLPDHEPWIVTEALIELGAMVCQKKAKCLDCPLKKGCTAFTQGLTDVLPKKGKKSPTQYLYRSVTVITHEDHFLIKRGKEGEVMHDLHEFPYFETGPNGLFAPDLTEKITETYGINAKYGGDLPEVKHAFTKYQVRLTPAYFVCEKRVDVEGMVWKSKGDLQKLAFSSGHRRLFQLLINLD